MKTNESIPIPTIALASHVGAKVELSGWLHAVRDFREFSFLVLRDGTGTAQLVVPKDVRETLGEAGPEDAAEQGVAVNPGRRTTDPLLCSIVDGDPESESYGRDDFTFNLIVSDVDAALRGIADAGGTVVGQAANGERGRFGWFIDPEGNRVELWQPKLN